LTSIGLSVSKNVVDQGGGRNARRNKAFFGIRVDLGLSPGLNAFDVLSQPPKLFDIEINNINLTGSVKAPKLLPSPPVITVEWYMEDGNGKAVDREY
jgi:hypothetical protein